MKIGSQIFGNNGLLSSSNLTYFLVAVIFLMILYYAYMRNREAAHTTEGFTESNLKAAEGEVVLVLFFAPWCGHCKAFKPEWEKAEQKLNNTTVGNNKVRLEQVDCDENPDIAKEYGVEGYPTVKLLTDNGEVKEYNNERTADGIEEFLRSLD